MLVNSPKGGSPTHSPPRGFSSVTSPAMTITTDVPGVTSPREREAPVHEKAQTQQQFDRLRHVINSKNVTPGKKKKPEIPSHFFLKNKV